MSMTVKDKPLHQGSLSILPATREVFLADSPIMLTKKEFDLLYYLMKYHQRVVPREELLENLWNLPGDTDTRTLDIHIKTIRKKIGDERHASIATIRGIGYRYFG